MYPNSVTNNKSLTIGCPNVNDLPEAEELSAKPRAENSDIGIIITLIGEYRAACLFSKTWALREAAG